MGHMVAAAVPDIPVAALVVHGIQGSAKTTLQKFVKGCLDPSAVAVRGGVKDQTEYAQAAWQNRAFFFDNLTHVPDWLSDALCRTVTGEGWSKRTLYTDEDSTTFEYRRVVGLSGINLVADRPDLLDRSVIVELEPLLPNRRRDERGLWADFTDRAPYIVGGMFDALARAMVIEPDLDLPALPRMADYARWGAAAAEALGLGADAFLAAYDTNVGRQNEAAVDASPIAQAALAFMDGKGEWSGSPSDLLAGLSEVAAEERIDTRARNWPKSASWVSRRLKEVLPNLTALGLEVALGHADTGRNIRLRKVTGNAVNAVSPVMAGAGSDTAAQEAARS
jgi:hypothetical protein